MFDVVRVRVYVIVLSIHSSFFCKMDVFSLEEEDCNELFLSQVPSEKLVDYVEKSDNED